MATDLTCDDCLALIEVREERAAIMHFDGGLPRQVAERRARELHPDRRECGHGEALSNQTKLPNMAEPYQSSRTP
jgi:hypothetical protein